MLLPPTSRGPLELGSSILGANTELRQCPLPSRPTWIGIDKFPWNAGLLVLAGPPGASPLPARKERVREGRPSRYFTGSQVQSLASSLAGAGPADNLCCAAGAQNSDGQIFLHLLGQTGLLIPRTAAKGMLVDLPSLFLAQDLLEPGAGEADLLARPPRPHLQGPHAVTVLIELHPAAGGAHHDIVPFSVVLEGGNK